ncbi:MAG: sulfatase [Verrucomicrobiales bacterium]|nr:sulfatase [Verrucomicrobiales bacterium]
MKYLIFPFLLAALAVPGLAQNESPKKNVLFIICDDLNCDIGSYGHPQVKTPNIDKLAGRGVLFKNAHCQYPLCGPSRASFMAGMYPDQTLIHRNAIYIREHLPNVKTMSQHFRDNGYFATRIGKIYHYNVPKHIGTSGHDDPYSWNYTINPRGRDVEDEPIIKTLRPMQFGGTLSWLAADGTDEEQTDGMIADAAVAELERYKKENRPFFLAVGLFRPHTPFVAPKKYFEMYPLDKIVIPEVPEGYGKTIPKPALNSIRRKKDQIDLPDETAREVIQAYYASITFADAQIGKVLDALEETGLAENTVVTFTSDHGYHMGEHGHWQKTTLFENATRVPMIIADPDQAEKGAESNCPVEMVDFYPTLAARCGLKTPDHLSGVDLSPVLADASATPRDSALSQYANGYSLRTPRYRYTEWGERGTEGIELYDHETDPAELNNLAADKSKADLINELHIQLTARIAAQKKKPEGIQQILFENRRRVR